MLLCEITGSNTELGIVEPRVRLVTPCLQEEMSGESVVSSAVPAAATRTTSFKGTSPSSKYVKLNIGGALYYTTMQTLTKQDTMLKAMFSGRMEVLTDSEGKGLLPRAPRTRFLPPQR